MKKKRIVEAARKLFHQFGFKKVSMDEIAREAGVTKKTIYMYFSSKEELLKYFILEEIEKMKEIIEKKESENTDIFKAVNEAIYELLKYRKETEFLNVISKEAEWLKKPELVKCVKMVDDKIKEFIREKLKVAKEKGLIYYEDLDITAFLVYKMYIALMFEWEDEKKQLDEKMIANNISSILKNGLRKEVE